MGDHEPPSQATGEPPAKTTTVKPELPSRVGSPGERFGATIADAADRDRADGQATIKAGTKPGSDGPIFSESDVTGQLPRATPVIPGYEILGVLGRGGMGVVYHARQVLLNRPCAVKMILAGAHAGHEAAVRFLAEAESVAKVQHPNVVQIRHIGEAEGLPFFELEYVEGGSLDRWLDGTPWPPQRAAAHIEALALGVAEAHRLGIVHRDLKPANVLIAADGTPKITDFGLAKSLNLSSGLTRTDSILGSPSYMAPEQAEGHAREAGREADIYSLGAILYELLTGRPPFKGATILQTIDLVKTAEPVPPTKLVPGTPRDIETIALKCLQKDPARRYDSAGTLAGDLQRFLEGRPISARPVGSVERLVRWCRRNPVVAGLGISAALLLATLAAVATVGYLGVSEALGRERNALSRERDTNQQAVGHLYHALVGEARALRVAREMGYREKVFDRLERAVGLETPERDPAGLKREAVASLGDFVGLAPLILRDLTPAKGYSLMRIALDARSEWLAVGFVDGSVRLFNPADGQERSRLPGSSSGVTGLAFASDGRLLIGHMNGDVRVAEKLHSGVPRIISKPGAGGVVLGFAPNEAGHWLVGAATGAFFSTYHGLSVRDLDGLPMEAVRLDGKDCFAGDNTVRSTKVIGGAIGPGGKLAAIVAVATRKDQRNDCRVFLWDLANRKLLAQRPVPEFGAGLDRCAFDSEGVLLAIGNDGGYKVLDVPGLTNRLSVNLESSTALRFSPDGQVLAVGTISQRVYLYSIKTNRELAVLKHPGRWGPTQVVFSDEGQTLASVNFDTVQLWNLAGAPERRELAGHSTGVPSVAFSPDGAMLASGGHDRVLKLWDPSSGRLLRTLSGFAAGVQACAFSPDGTLLATGLYEKGRLQIWEVGSGKEPLYTTDLAFPIVPQLGFVREAGGGADLLASTGTGLRIWRVSGGHGIPFSPQPIARVPGQMTLGVALSPDGASSAFVELGPGIRIWDISRGQFQKFSGPSPIEGWHAVAFRAAGELVYIAQDGRAVVWNVREDRLVRQIGEPGTFERGHVAVSPDGRWLAAEDTSTAVAIVDLERGEIAFSFREERCPIYSLAWSPDSRRLAIGLSDGGLIVWDLQAVGQRLTELGLEEAGGTRNGKFQPPR